MVAQNDDDVRIGRSSGLVFFSSCRVLDVVVNSLLATLPIKQDSDAGRVDIGNSIRIKRNNKSMHRIVPRNPYVIG